ncbi:MAG: class I SAM-dependent methyltransferase [Chitinophagales bacterium]
MKSISYHFKVIETCNMCGSPTSGHRIMGRRLNGSQGRNPKKKVGITTTVMKCTDCGLIYSNPQPIPLNIQDHYGVPPEKYWKESYFVVDPNYFKEEIDRLRTLIEIKPGMKSLDIGAGLGKGMISMMNAGFDAYGLEPSESFYERAISKMKIPADRLKLGMMEDLDYPENNFDFVSFGAVLEHVYDPALCIERAMKWLKPNGILHIEVPSSDWLIHKIWNIYYALTMSEFVSNISPMHEPFHLYEFGLTSFNANAKKLGYEVAKSEYFVCRTFMPKLLDKILVPYMDRTNKGMQLVVWLRKK